VPVGAYGCVVLVSPNTSVALAIARSKWL
jgi:hypothetical protein